MDFIVDLMIHVWQITSALYNKKLERVVWKREYVFPVGAKLISVNLIAKIEMLPLFFSKHPRFTGSLRWYFYWEIWVLFFSTRIKDMDK